MPTPFLPYQRDPIAGNATTTDAWYQFFIGLRQFLVSSGLDTGIIDQILARLDELEQNQVGAFVIQGLMSVDVFGTPEDGFVQIQLVGDVESPGTNYYYGTDDTGVKGWFNSASNLKITSLTGSTYSTVQDFVNTMHSPGIIQGGEVTDIGSGNVRILAGTGMIRIADDDVSSLPFFNFAQTDFAVPNDQLTRFFGVVYNAGSPVVEMRTSYNWNKDTEIPLGSAVRLSATITNVTPNKYRMGDPITNVIQRFDAQSPAIRDNSIGGLLIGEAGVRNVTVTAGKIWSRLSDFDSAAKNSSVDTMLSVYFNGVNLTVTSGITQWDNLNFNTGGALVVMGNNKWANLWFFISIDGTKYGFAYGTGEHNSLGAAANEGLPFYLTQNFFNQTLLLGRFVFQKGAATAGLIETAFTSIFNTSAVNNHNDLAGLQGGAVGEYYHMTADQNADVVTLSAGGTTGQFWRGDQAYSNALVGPLILQPAAGPVHTITPLTNQLSFAAQSQTATDAQILFNPQPTDGTSQALFRFFRTTNTTGAAAFELFRGDNTNTPQIAFFGKGGNSYISANNGNFALFSTGSFGGGTKVFSIANATVVPTSNPAGGGLLYAEAGAGKWRGSGGTITTFGPADPHCPICSSDFVHEWENPKYGYLAVCMNCLCDGINSHTRVKGEWSTHGN